MLKNTPKKPGNLPAETSKRAPLQIRKGGRGKLAIDESTIDRLLEIRKNAFSDNPEITIDRALFASLLRNQNAAVALMRAGESPSGYIVANPIRESWVGGDVEEIKGAMEPGMEKALYEKVSEAMGSGSCYYVDDLAIARGGSPGAGEGRSALSQLDGHSEMFREAAGMVRSFFSQLEAHSAKFLVLHGRKANEAYKGYTKRIEMNGFRKLHEADQPNWIGGEDFMLMVFEKSIPEGKS